MVRLFLTFVACVFSVSLAAQDPGRGPSLERFLNEDVIRFHNQTPFPKQARRAYVVSSVNPSTETHDFVEDYTHCDPSKNFQRRIRWNNGSCASDNGSIHRFIEQINENGDILYFKCTPFGISAHSLMSRHANLPLGNPAEDVAIQTRVVIRGRSVGTFDGIAPNTYIAGDIRRLPTDNDETLYDRFIQTNGGILKLEISHASRSFFHKFSMSGLKRALVWCETGKL